MKKNITYYMIGIMTTLFFSACASTNYATQNPETFPPDITYQTFYDNLSPYGTWIDYPGYGNVWNPHMQADFRPYATNGRWAYSQQGWAWQSNYNWGWAPFHYGSWIYDDMYGWLWKPGYEWSPAWVTWGSSGNNYAWAPLMPEVNIGVQFGNYRPHAYYWNVCGRDHIYDRNISNVIVHNTNVTNNITIINNYNKNTTNNYYAKGPDVNEVQRYTRNKIEPVTFKDVNQIKQTRQIGNVVQVYRPTVQNNSHSRSAESNTPATPINNNGFNGADRQRNYTNRNQQVPVQNQQPNSIQKTDNNVVKQSTDRSVLPQTSNSRLNVEKQRNQENSNQQIPENNSNRNPNSNQFQNIHPRQFRRAETEQTRPVRNNSAAPVNQPRQQRQNVQQLPMQRMERGNNNNNKENGNGRNNKRNN